MPRPRVLVLALAIVLAGVATAAPQVPTAPVATAPAATAPGSPDGLSPGDIDGAALLTATPTVTPIAKMSPAPSAAGNSNSDSNSVHLSESALAGIIVGCILGGLLLGLVSSAVIFLCLTRRHEYYEEYEDESAAQSPEKLHPTRSQQQPPSPSPRSPNAPSVPPRPDGLGMTALQPTESGNSELVAPSLPSIHCPSLGTPADWEAERARRHPSGPSVHHVPTGTALGYSDSRPITPTRFWRGLRDRRVSQMTIRSAKTKAKRASIVTVKSMKSGKSRRASILTARSKLSGRSKNSHKAGGADAPPVPPLPFTRRVPVPPLSPGLANMPPKRPKRRVHMRLITPDPPAQVD